MKLASIYVGIALGGLALAQAGCSGGPECGAGTIEVDEACLPAEDVCGTGSTYNPDTGQCEATADCATGTVFQDGECVPDGSVVCETGTMFDPETGTCVADITGCAEGTVQVGDECVPYDDTLVPDVQEPQEPNDDSGFGTIDLPAEGDMVTIGGCVVPYDRDGDGELDQDFDGFTMNASEPMLLRITVDGLGGLAGGFILDSSVPDLATDGWLRYGVSMVNDTSQRQVLLPASGDYLIRFGDSRALLAGAAAGGPDTCYFATIERVAMPDPSAITTEASGNLSSDSAFYSYDPQTDGDAIRSLLSATSPAAVGSVVHVVGGTYRHSGSGDPAAARAGLLADDEVLIVVESVFDYSLTPVPYELAVNTDGAVELLNGEPTELESDLDGAMGGEAIGNLAWFEGTGGEIVNASFTADTDVDIGLFDSRFQFIGLLCPNNAPPCTAGQEYVQIPESGIYYWDILNRTPDAEEGDAFTVTATWSGEAVAPAEVGTAVDDAALGEDGNDFYELTVEDLAWLVASGAPTGFGGALEVTLYPRGQAGVLDLYLAGDGPLSFTTGTEEYGRIFDFAAPSQTFLVRVSDSGFDGTADDETYDLAVNEREHTVVDLTSGAPFTATDVAVEAGATNYYLVLANSRERVVVDATDVVDADVAIHQLDEGEVVDETANAGGAAASERVGRLITQQTWFAMSVEELGAAAGSYDLTVDYDMVDVTASVDVGGTFGSPQDALLEVTEACTIEAVTLDVDTTAIQADTGLDLYSPANTERWVWFSSIFGGDIVSGNFPFDLTPDEPLDYAGEEAQGTWRLSYYNTLFGSGGTLESFGLNFYCAP